MPETDAQPGETTQPPIVQSQEQVLLTALLESQRSAAETQARAVKSGMTALASEMHGMRKDMRWILGGTLLMVMLVIASVLGVQFKADLFRGQLEGAPVPKSATESADGGVDALPGMDSEPSS